MLTPERPRTGRCSGVPEGEHAPAEREQHVGPRLRPGRRPPVRRGERVGSDGLGRLSRQVSRRFDAVGRERSEEHTSELQSLRHLVCRLLLEKKKKNEWTCRQSLTNIDTVVT